MPHSCGSRNGLQVFLQDDGTYDGYCFACNKKVLDPYGDKPQDWKPEFKKKSKEQVQAEIEEINNLPCLELPSRKLRKEVLEYYNIKVAVSEQDGVTPAVVYFPYTKDAVLTGYKAKVLETGQMWSIGDVKDVDLFGWEQALQTGAKRLVIVEGEFDAPALHRIIQLHTKEAYRDYIPAVVSIPHGAGTAARDITRVQTKLRQTFREVVLCFDADDAGRKAVEAVCKIFPEAINVNLPAKDANACILEGKQKAAFAAVTFKAEKQKNTRLVFGSSLREAARKAPEWGYSWPWKRLTEATRGIRFGETIYIGAAPKMG